MSESIPKFKVGDEVFICDGGELHGKIVKITKVDPYWCDPRYDGVLPDKQKFHFAKEIGFCAIEKGICELCGGQGGIIKPLMPIPEFGRSEDIARAKFPYGIRCICKVCKDLLKKNEDKRKEMVNNRIEFIDLERKRRKENHLCSNCGGGVTTSGPHMVYEGTYETIHRCDHCRKEDRYT